MLTKESALEKLKYARDVFKFSLGAYALLTEEPSRSEMSSYDIKIYEDGEIIVLKGIGETRRGTNYTIGFNQALSNDSARAVVDNSFKQMLIDSNHVIQRYIKDNEIDASCIPAVQFLRHYRNAIAHNGRWDIRSDRRLPLTWRNRTITIEMNNQPIDGFISWFEGLQLCAQMNLFVAQGGQEI